MSSATASPSVKEAAAQPLAAGEPVAEGDEGHPRSRRAAVPPPDALDGVKRRARQRLFVLGILLVAASVASPVLQGLSPTKSYAIASESMEPGIPKGALVVTSAQPVATGDVVVYWSPTGEYQAHRIVETIVDGDRILYRTAGDANEAEDSFLVPAEDVEGKVLRHSPYVGYLWLLPGWAQAAAFAAAVLLYLALTAWEARALLTKRLPRRLRQRVRPLLRLGSLLRFGLIFVTITATTPAMAGIASEQPASGHTFDMTGTPLPFSAGTAAAAQITDAASRASVTLPSPRLWKEIPMWNCKKEGTCTTTLSPGFSEEIGSWARIDMADYDPQPVVYFEAYFAAPAGLSARVHLYDTTNNVEVSGSEVSTTSTSLTLVRSGSLSLSGVRDYTIRSAHTGQGQGGEIAHARLLLVQDFSRKTADQVRLSQGTEESTTSWAVPARAAKWRFDGSATDGITGARFEIIAEVDGDMLTASRVRLMDRTAGTIVTTLTVGILDTSPRRFVSADIQQSLLDGHEYEIEVRRGDGLLSNRLHLYVARVHILQSGFNETVRYVDLSWQTTTTSTTFVAGGAPGQYHLASEWGGRRGHFEVTMRNSDPSGVSSAALYDRTASVLVAGSTVTVTGTTLVRVRSQEVDFGATASTYEMHFKASSGTAELRQAWLIVHQGPGKSYDHILATSDSTGDCTWSISVHLVSTVDAGRLRHASISIRTASLVDQVRFEDGVATLFSGPAVDLANSARLDYVVRSDPGAAGTTTLYAEQRARCSGYGIHLTSPITFVFA